MVFISSNDIRDIVKGTIATVIGGVLLTLIFFVSEDYIFRINDLSGKWNIKTTTNKTSYKPFKGMKLNFTALIQQKGRDVIGSAEKNQENVNGKTKQYNGKNRINLTLTGYIEKRYFSKNTLVVHLIQNGKKRNSSVFHMLSIDDDCNMSGKFESTVANSVGVVKWRKSTCQ